MAGYVLDSPYINPAYNLEYLWSHFKFFLNASSQNGLLKTQLKLALLSIPSWLTKCQLHQLSTPFCKALSLFQVFSFTVPSTWNATSSEMLSWWQFVKQASLLPPVPWIILSSLQPLIAYIMPYNPWSLFTGLWYVFCTITYAQRSWGLICLCIPVPRTKHSQGASVKWENGVIHCKVLSSAFSHVKQAGSVWFFPFELLAQHHNL